jgi:hypothetical protein
MEVQRKTDMDIRRRRYRLLPEVVDQIVEAGGVVTMTKAELEAAIKDKSVLDKVE